MPQVLVRDIETDVLEKLKRRAQKNHRSLEAELRVVFEQAVAEPKDQASRWAMLLLRLPAFRSCSPDDVSVTARNCFARIVTDESFRRRCQRRPEVVPARDP